MANEFKVKNGLIVDQGGATITGSVTATAGFTGSLQGTGSWANSSSYAVTAATASYLSTLNQNLTFNGNLTLNGTASIQYLNVQYETASVIYSSGSNQFGDAPNDVQSLYGSVIVQTGSLTVSGSTTLRSNTTPNTDSIFQVLSGRTTSSLNVINNNTVEIGSNRKIIFYPDVSNNNGSFISLSNLLKSYELYSSGINGGVFFVYNRSDSKSPIVVTPDKIGLGINTDFSSATLAGAALIVTASRVGIGTATPSASLHISGLSNSALLEIDSPAVDNILYISGSGNVGIGTATPGYALEIANVGLYYAGASQAAQLLITTSGSVGAKEGSFIAAGAIGDRTLQLGIADNSSTPVGIDMFETNNTFGSTYLNFRVNNANLVRMTGSNVGIGTITPAYNLDLYGTYHQYQAQGLLARYDISSANANQNRGVWDFYTNAAVTPDFFGRFGFKFEGGTADSFKQFQVHIADSTTPKFVVDGSGRVGIGTTTPAYKLDVSGSGNFTNGLTVTGSFNVSGSTTQIGNNTLIGNTVLSGSIRISGSSDIQGTTTMTGSLIITGSTTQIGNNTLIGNTLLSGSIIISGSATTPVTPSIKIYGDMETNGVIKFMPVVKSIDTSISASYIYVSGSTQDLYFSQNGGGFNNVTRLRWLEGNLYTGLLHGGLITTQSSTVYQVTSGSGIIVNLNASIATDPYPIVQYLTWPNLSASIATLSASFDQSFVAINSSTAITAQGTPYNNGQFNTTIPIGIVIHQNRSTINAIQTFPGMAYGWKQRSFDFIKAFGPLKISGYTLTPSGSSTGSLVLSGGTAWVDGRNYTVDPNNPSYIVEASGIVTSKIYRYRQSGSGWAYDTNGGAGYGTIDPTQYSLNGVLTPVPTNDYTIQRVFYFPNSATKAFYIYYGNDSYPTQAEALAATLTEEFSEAPNTAANAIYVGYMLLRHNADFTVPASFTFQSAGLFRLSGAGGGAAGGSTTPGGSTTQIQYNNVGTFAGVPVLTYNGTTLQGTGSFSGSFTGLINSASFAVTASYASVAQTLLGSVTSASFASTASFLNPGTYTVTSSWAINASTASYVTGSIFTSTNRALSASYALTASYALNGGSGATFPYTGNAVITGSLVVSGSSLGLDTGLGGLTKNGQNKVDWQGSVLVTDAGLNSVDWENRTLYDTTGNTSADWTSRVLYTPTTGDNALNYSNDLFTTSNIYKQQNTRNSTVGESLSDTLLSYSGHSLQAVVTGSAVTGNILYLDTDGTWKTVNQTTVTSTKMLGISLTTNVVLLEGDVVLEAGTMIKTPTYGAPLYIWEGGTVLSSDIPTSGYVRVLGHCYYQNTSTTDNWIVKFRPSNDWYQI
jgi:hypothetical protein